MMSLLQECFTVYVFIPFAEGYDMQAAVRRVLLVSLDWSRPKDPPVSLGTASILANLSKHQTDTTHLSYNVNREDFHPDHVVEAIFAQKPLTSTLLGMGAFVWNEHHTQDILTKLQQYGFPGKVLLGGPQVSYTSGKLEKYYPQVDVFCRGYAEDAVVKYVQRSTIDNETPTIPGLVYKGREDLKLQATCDLGSLPSPFLEGFIPPQRFLRWETQRGCPFRCSFCQHRESDLPNGSPARTRQALDRMRLSHEVKWLCESQVTDIAVLDPTFNSGPNYLDILDSFTENKFKGKLSLQCRFEMVKDEFLDRVVALNSQGAKIVLEFGLQTIIREEAKAVMRPNRMKAVEAVIKQLNSLGIQYEVSLIFGLPLQTLKSFKESVRFCLHREVPVIKAWPLMILRGTPLDTDKTRKLYNLEERAISASDKIDRVQVNIPHVVSSATFSFDDWRKMADIATVLSESEGNHPSDIS